MQTGWVKDGTRWYYLAGNGAMKTGWLKIGEKTFYLTKSGARATGWRTIGDKRYYFRSNGVLDARKTKKAGTSASPVGKNTADQKEGASSGSGPKTKGDMVAEYALKNAAQPLGISEYKLSRFLPDEIKSSLPSIEEIEAGLSEQG